MEGRGSGGGTAGLGCVQEDSPVYCMSRMRYPPPGGGAQEKAGHEAQRMSRMSSRMSARDEQSHRLAGDCPGT